MSKLIIKFIEKIGVCKSVDLIIPHIYLGNINSSQNINFIQDNNVQLIVNCSRNIPFLEEFTGEKIRIPIDDNRIFKNKDILNFLNVLEIIHKYREENKNILIHCRLGSQRSANIVLLYLIKKLDLDFNFSYNLIKRKREICFVPINSFNHIY